MIMSFSRRDGHHFGTVWAEGDTCAARFA